ncbi:TrmB family transcriptional regulator [Salinigranum marinum]|uniref:TrmB family transcriptional regulator n=1 Tax=Salinigranum marinum TaxID=1515595 RepID=UPI002989A7C5|nr:TrmB family transcriptional regulator [Salinigranum marinum]
MATLRDLGLSEYEARSYRSLLDLGPTTAKELSRTSDVPMGRVYDVLNGLEQDGLVRSQAASRPKKYVAVEPETGLERLLGDKRAELERKVEQYEAVVEELSEELDARGAVDEQFWTAAIGPDESGDLLVERLAAADERLVMVAGTPSPQFDIGQVSGRVVDRLDEALDRGVRASLLLSPGLVESLPETVWDDYHARLVTNEGFEARVASEVSGTFNLIDDVEVCIEVPNPLDPAQAFAMIDLKDPEFAANLREAFDERWVEAEPLSL